MSKNNPENRGEAAKARKYNGKVVKPVLYIGPDAQGKKTRFIAAQFEDGKLVRHPVTKAPIAHKFIQG